MIQFKIKKKNLKNGNPKTCYIDSEIKSSGCLFCKCPKYIPKAYWELVEIYNKSQNLARDVASYFRKHGVEVVYE